ncbi:hypothetical protein [Lacipirellula parvula]|uniref:Uncharacterized protein n=1 Tax=Lacipirellula parvula TaxID=2650471 RepID=A0A5K7XEL7_9BACT|nr:hypothetical protein [Lacipirellula parvula]BBO32673.1 hypothetical protein PLANPX_2285 [Lacipirellula parvula]
MKSLFNRSTAAMVAAALACGAGAGTKALAQVPNNFPAAPLAGGQAAYQGGAYQNAYGESIVMPASYNAPGPGYGEMCQPGCQPGCEYGDPGNADFGGYGTPDQCGPHYFDIAANAVFLQSDRSFRDVPPLGSVGVAGPTILDLADLNEDYEAGWEIAARLDLGPLSVFEMTYMGIYDLGFNTTVNSVDVANGVDYQLNSVFSEYGVFPIDGLDEGSVYNVDYQSDLQSTELSYRRYWVGYNPRISGTYLAGFRYVRMTEEMSFDATALLGDSSINWDTTNDLVGAQLGGDGWIALRQGLRLGGEVKGGIYNNRFKYGHQTNIPDPDISNVNFNADGNQVAFVGEAKFDLVADILPSVSLRGGYRVLYMSSLVTVGNNIDPFNVASTALYTQADAVYNGFHGGIEYIW